MDERWVESLKRLSAANERVRRERLRRFARDESIARFEELCRSVHAQFDAPPVRKTHPIGLIKLWKRP